MICFLTSRTDLPGHEELNPANRFIDELRRVLPNPCRALNICSDPNAWEKTDFYASLTRLYFENAGFCFDSFRVLDGRSAAQAKELVRESNLVILGGGHVPTQNRFCPQSSVQRRRYPCPGEKRESCSLPTCLPYTDGKRFRQYTLQFPDPPKVKEDSPGGHSYGRMRESAYSGPASRIPAPDNP